MTTNQAPKKRRRSVPLLWGSGALAAAVLVLGVSGTLSTWTTAIITNSTNTAKAGDAVILQETGPGPVTCNSTDNNNGSNGYTCSTINKYGGTATPIQPGGSQAVTVTLKNTGTASAALTLAPGTCSKSGGSPTATQDICDVATVAVSCTTPSTLSSTPAALADATNWVGQTIAVATLAAGASTDCTFTVAIPSNASPQIAGQTASQALVWTLS